MKSLMALILMFLLTSCTTGEKVGALLVTILILVVGAVIGIIILYIHNKDKINKVMGVAQEIKNTVSGGTPTPK
jgi:hypothetical protein